MLQQQKNNTIVVKLQTDHLHLKLSNEMSCRFIR